MSFVPSHWIMTWIFLFPIWELLSRKKVDSRLSSEQSISLHYLGGAPTLPKCSEEGRDTIKCLAKIFPTLWANSLSLTWSVFLVNLLITLWNLKNILWTYSKYHWFYLAYDVDWKDLPLLIYVNVKKPRNCCTMSS